MRLLVSISAAFSMLFIPAVGLADTTTTTPTDPPTVVSKKRIRPADKRHRVHFKPWSKPTVSQVHEILRLEHRRWGGPWLTHRVGCESNFRWYANNGSHFGLLQFGSIWGSMWPGTPRRVYFKAHHWVHRWGYEYTTYSDGSTIRRQTRKYRVKRTRIYRGLLPRHPSPFNGWAAVRVGQRAVSGDGPTTGWSCSL